MSYESDYQAHLDKLGIKHFGAHEILCGCMKDGNELPPRALWDNFAPTILVLDRCREELGIPIHLARKSPEGDWYARTYRAEHYPSGGKRSTHRAFMAADVDGGMSARNDDILWWLQQLKTTDHTNYLDLFEWPGNPLIESPIDFTRVLVTLQAGRVPFHELEEWAEVHGQRKRFRFRGGLALYDWGVHVDTRGYNATWQG